jgi:hypothetical protein
MRAKENIRKRKTNANPISMINSMLEKVSRSINICCRKRGMKTMMKVIETIEILFNK